MEHLAPFPPPWMECGSGFPLCSPRCHYHSPRSRLFTMLSCISVVLARSRWAQGGRYGSA
jgi:hypothetical protein